MMSAILLLAVANGTTLLDQQFRRAGTNAVHLKGFVEAAGESYGEFGQRAAVFLIEGMPQQDLSEQGVWLDPCQGLKRLRKN